MNPNLKCFAAVRLNGEVTQLGETQLKYVPAKLGQFILAAAMIPQKFSTLELKISKRPIAFTSDSDSEWLDSLTLSADLDDDWIDDKRDITHGELADVITDPVWSHRLALNVNPDGFEPETANRIREDWTRVYGNTKFARLIK